MFFSISDIKESSSIELDSTENTENVESGQDISYYRVLNPTKLDNKAWWECYKDDKNLLYKLNERVNAFEEDMKTFYNSSIYYNSLYNKQHRNHKRFVDLIVDKSSTNDIMLNNLSFNITKVAVDSHYNNLIKTIPKVTFQGKGASSELITHAQSLDEYLFNCFKKGNLFKSSREAAKSAMINNIGHVKIECDYDNKCFNYSKINPYNFLIEKPYEGSRQREEFIEKKKIAVWQLKELIEKIGNKTKMSEFKEIFKSEEMYGFVTIYEAYKTNKYKVIFTEKMILYKEEWNFDFLPYSQLFWDHKEEGYIQSGIAEIVEDCQVVVNWLIYIILNNADTYQANYLAIPAGSDYAQQLSNEFGAIIQYNSSDGGRPYQIQPSIINPQYFDFLNRVYVMGLKKARVSQAQQDGELPKNLRASGTALNTFNTMDSSRFVANKEDFQGCFLDIARKTVEMAISKYSSYFPFLRYVKKNKEEFYKHMQVFPESILNESPQNKIALAQQLFNAQQINLEQYLSIIQVKPEEIPNVSTSRLKKRAAISKQLEISLATGKQMLFDEFLGVDVQEDVALKKYDELLAEGEYETREEIDSDPKIINIRNYLNAIKEAKEALIQQKMREAQTMQILQQGQKTQAA